MPRSIGGTWLCGESFSVADLNVACVTAFATLARIDLSHHPNAERWLKACMAREAARKVFALALADAAQRPT